MDEQSGKQQHQNGWTNKSVVQKSEPGQYPNLDQRIEATKRYKWLAICGLN